MADTAWSPIQYSDEDGNVTLIAVGESVSASDVGGDEEFELLKNAGAVRDVDYPDDVAPNESVRERNIRVVSEKMEEIAEAGFDMSDVDLVPLDVNVTPIVTEEQEGTQEVETPKRSAAKASSGGASGNS